MLQSYDTSIIAGKNLRQACSFTHALGASGVVAPLLGAVSLILFFLNTRHGIGVLPDSTRYMGMDQNPYDAPVYAWLLRASVPLGIDFNTMATAVAVIVLSLNVVLVTAFLFRITEHIIYAAAGSALILFSPHFVTFHSLAMSEPLFLLFLLLTLHLSLTFLQTENRFWLVLTGLALGLATLTRFTAPPLGAALALVFLLDRRHRLTKRIANAAILFAISGTMFFGWVTANHYSGEQSIGRELSFLGTMGLKEWYKSFVAMVAWFLPDDVPNFMRFPVFILALGMIAFLAWKQGLRTLGPSPVKKPGTELILVVLAFAFMSYVAFVFLASAIEANLFLNGRYGFPAYVFLIFLSAGLISRHFALPKKSKALAVGVATFAVLILAAHGASTAVRTYDAFQNGIGYNSLVWKSSPTVASLRKLPADAAFYSNGSDAVAYVVRKPSRYIPHEWLLRTNLPDATNPLPQQIAAIRERAETQSVYVVYFDMIWWRPYLIDEKKLKADLGMELVESLPDGRIYKVTADTNVSPSSPMTEPEDAQ
jgi:hypothetical protein